MSNILPNTIASIGLTKIFIKSTATEFFQKWAITCLERDNYPLRSWWMEKSWPCWSHSSSGSSRSCQTSIFFKLTAKTFFSEMGNWSGHCLISKSQSHVAIAMEELIPILLELLFIKLQSVTQVEYPDLHLFLCLLP